MQRDEIPIRPYRPATGTEGAIFDEKWCARCAKERKFRESGDGEDGCRIVADALALDITDPCYPREWVKTDERGPMCTAFMPDVGQQWPPDPTPQDLEAAGQLRLIA